MQLTVFPHFASFNFKLCVLIPHLCSNGYDLITNCLYWWLLLGNWILCCTFLQQRKLIIGEKREKMDEADFVLKRCPCMNWAKTCLIFISWLLPGECCEYTHKQNIIRELSFSHNICVTWWNKINFMLMFPSQFIFVLSKKTKQFFRTKS